MRCLTRLVSCSLGVVIAALSLPPALAQRQFEAVPSGVRLPVDADATVSVAAADVDGDGDLDLVIGNYEEPKKLYLNDGTGVFTDVTGTQMPSSPPGSYSATVQLALADVDGDSDADIVLATSGLYGNRQNELYLNNGAGTFVDATQTRLPVAVEYTTCVALGDVDGDGDLDIVFGNYLPWGGGSPNNLYLNTGAGRFVDATADRLPRVLGDTSEVVLADVDGDGDLDLVCSGGFGRRQNRLFCNNGRGFFGDVTAAQMPVDNDDSRSVALADVDGDADLDMVIGNNGADRLYLNDGTGKFTDATAGRLPATADLTRGVALADVDGDLDVDLVLADFGESRLLLNDGTGRFFDATATRFPASSGGSSSLVLADLDGDADPDIVFGHNLGQNVLYLNAHRQLSSSGRAVLSTRYDLELRSSPGYGSTTHTGAVVLGTGLAQPSLSLPPLGRFYLTPSPLLALPPVAIPPATGEGVVSIAIPGNPSLVGAVLYSQGLIVSPAGAHFTGWVADEIAQ